MKTRGIRTSKIRMNNPKRAQRHVPQGKVVPTTVSTKIVFQIKLWWIVALLAALAIAFQL